MASLKAVVRKWEQLPNMIIPIAAKCMEEKKEQLIGLNTEQLYEQGVDRAGNKLPAYKSKDYAARKQQLRGKSISDRYLTGAFQSAMNLSVSGGQFALNSTVGYARHVINRDEKNGNIIMGLTPDSKKKAWMIIRQLFIGKVKEIR